MGVWAEQSQLEEEGEVTRSTDSLPQGTVVLLPKEMAESGFMGLSGLPDQTFMGG